MAAFSPCSVSHEVRKWLAVADVHDLIAIIQKNTTYKEKECTDDL